MGSFEEWFDWQIMLALKAAGIEADRQVPISLIQSSLFAGKKMKVVDTKGSTEFITFVFEMKFNRNGVSEAWKDVRISLREQIAENRNNTPSKNLLVAGIPFTDQLMTKPQKSVITVSYTHLTLPTIYSV